MYHIKTLNKISPSGLSVFEKEHYAVSDSEANEDAVLVRSADMLSYDFSPRLLAVARAGAGTNNIPVERCAEAGIVVFNTPGANANAVKELVLCALLMSSRKIAAGTKWIDSVIAEGQDITTVVEKGKSQFVGPELAGKTLGVIGLGAVGVQVANIATKLGMTVYGYDPYLSVDAALSLSRAVHRAADLESIYKIADYLTIHVPQNKETKNMISESAIHLMKSGVRILNFARGGLVGEEDMIAALESGKVAAYVTDFPTNALAATKNVTLIPHLGASTPESEENCAVMAAGELKEYLEQGNIKNSVNFPDIAMNRSGDLRLSVIHRNSPGMLSSVTKVLSDEKINVENLTNKSKGAYAVTLVDTNQRISDTELHAIEDIEGVLRVRCLAY